MKNLFLNSFESCSQSYKGNSDLNGTIRQFLIFSFPVSETSFPGVQLQSSPAIGIEKYAMKKQDMKRDNLGGSSEENRMLN